MKARIVIEYDTVASCLSIPEWPDDESLTVWMLEQTKLRAMGFQPTPPPESRPASTPAGTPPLRILG